MIETKGTPIHGMKPVIVEWEDAAAKHGWHCLEDDDLTEAIRCVTIGFLVEKTRRYVKITTGAGEAGHVDSTSVIPRSCVISMDTLEVKSG